MPSARLRHWQVEESSGAHFVSAALERHLPGDARPVAPEPVLATWPISITPADVDIDIPSGPPPALDVEVYAGTPLSSVPTAPAIDIHIYPGPPVGPITTTAAIAIDSRALLRPGLVAPRRSTV
jgi:hypothetical protein